MSSEQECYLGAHARRSRARSCATAVQIRLHRRALLSSPPTVGLAGENPDAWAVAQTDKMAACSRLSDTLTRVVRECDSIQFVSVLGKLPEQARFRGSPVHYPMLLLALIRCTRSPLEPVSVRRLTRLLGTC